MKKVTTFFENIKRERGAIVAEATIALTAFIFAIYLVLSIVDICYVQAKMGIALNSAAKEMSHYAYMYDALGLNGLTGEGGKSSEFFNDVSEALNVISQGAADQAENDSLAEYIKNGSGMLIARECVKKNLVAFEGDTPDAFLRRCHVKDGFNGLNFLRTTFLTDKAQNEISLVVSYKVQVIRLLGTEYTFNFVQKAETKAWGKGESKDSGGSSSSEKKSIWDIGPSPRGDSIITSEKKNYKYTSSSNGFHAYDPKKNQFILITSIDTFSDSYKDDVSSIKSRISQAYSTVTSQTSYLDENISVKDSSGKDVTLKSDKDTRTYKLVLVVPDSTDMETFNKAVNEFKALNPDIEIEVKTGYGDPAEAKKANTETK